MNKVAIITGASGGIGGAIARTFANNGYYLALMYNSNKTACENLASELNKITKVKCYKCDLSSDIEIEKISNKILEDWGQIDTLVNNAGISIDKLFADKTSGDFRKTMDVNVIGAFALSRKIAESMYTHKKGNIINISSTNGINTYYPMCADYDASKAALISLSHNLAMQYSPYVRVNCVAPGFIGTKNELDNMDEEFIASEKEKILTHTLGTPEDVAELCLFLASDKAKFINNTTIRIDGGMYGEF